MWGKDTFTSPLLTKIHIPGGYGSGYGRALQAALFTGHDKMVELLLSNGADLS